MKEINYNRNDYDRLLDYGIPIGSGSEGDCYLINKKVYKLLYDPINKEDFKYDDLSNVNTESFIFAQELIISNNQVIGYVTKYVQGGSLNRIDYSHFIYDDFVNAIEQVKKDIKTISDLHIKGYDICDCNILFDGKRFHFIDTIEYTYSNEDSLTLYYRNMECFLSAIFRLLKNDNKELYLFIINNELSKALSKDAVLYYPVEYLKLLKKELNDCINSEILEIKDMNKVIKKR